MSRIADTFAACAQAGRAALVTFVTAGDPTPGDTDAILDALVEGGADVIELGMPFTDPMADGPAIQKANIRSLEQHPNQGCPGDRQCLPGAPSGRAAGPDGLCQSDDRARP